MHPNQKIVEPSLHCFIASCAIHSALFALSCTLSTIAAHVGLKVMQGGMGGAESIEDRMIIMLQISPSYALSSCKLRRHMLYQVTNCAGKSCINKISIPMIYQELLQLQLIFHFTVNLPLSCDFPLKPIYLVRSPFGFKAAIFLASAAATWTAIRLCFDYSASLTGILCLSGHDSIH
jgi:hypothetical protein